MKFGIHVGHLGGPLDELRRLWRFADSSGFYWFSASDHFQESPPQDGNGDCFEAVSTMAAVASDTTRIRVGCLVFCVNYRNPGLLAKALCTIDHLSGGRTECGIGAGWHKVEYQGYGIPFEPIGVREDQLEEAVQILRLLFDQRISNFKGKHFQLNDARCNPKPLQKRLRIWIGGVGEKRTLRAVARYADGWNGGYLEPAAWKAKNTLLDQWCEKEKRDATEIIRSSNVGFYMGADEKGAARQEALFRAHWSAQRPGDGYLLGTPRQAVEMIHAYSQAGVQQLNIVLREGPYDWEALHAFATEVMPAFGISKRA
jgi:alkanesulfonate monooxygenase SsuD/methylene tetrahydromethanopterin reductase-like flavin-dependent oxidoreductase (luciferase family)